MKFKTKIMYIVRWCDTIIKDERREETSKFAALYVCNENLFALSFSLLFAIQPEISPSLTL